MVPPSGFPKGGRGPAAEDAGHTAVVTRRPRPTKETDMMVDLPGMASLLVIVVIGLLAALGLASSRYGVDTATDDPNPGLLS